VRVDRREARGEPVATGVNVRGLARRLIPRTARGDAPAVAPSVVKRVDVPLASSPSSSTESCASFAERLSPLRELFTEAIARFAPALAPLMLISSPSNAICDVLSG